MTVVTCDGQNNPVPGRWKRAAHSLYEIRALHAPALQERSWQRRLAGLDSAWWRGIRSGRQHLESAGPGYHAPEWYYIAETGNINSSQVDNALNAWSGKVVFIPMFDSTCNLDPPGPAVDACPPPNVGGNGQNQWYHLPQVGAFLSTIRKGPSSPATTGPNAPEAAAPRT